MADHQPGVRPQYRQMVADGFGVGRPDADVHQRNAAPFARDQMVGRHLMIFPRQVRYRLLRIVGVGGDQRAAGARQRLIRAGWIGNLVAGPAYKLIDVTGVVGEQHKRLEVFGTGAGVVAQARQREIGA